MSACVSEWAVLQDLQQDLQENFEQQLKKERRQESRRAGSLHRNRRGERGSTRSTRSHGDTLKEQDAMVPDGGDTSPLQRCWSVSRLSIHDISRPHTLAADSSLASGSGHLAISGSGGHLSTHDVSNHGIHLPQPQFELHGEVTLTPHVTLSRPTTPGKESVASRQPSLHRHRASAVLEELRSHAGSAGDTGQSRLSTGSALSTLKTSLTSVSVPLGNSRRWKIRPQLLAMGTCCLTMLVTGFMMAYQSPANRRHVLSSGERRQNHLLAVGCLLGSLVGGVLLLSGRRRPLLAACVADTVVWTLPIFSADPWLAYTAEILTGLVSCAVILLVLIYIAEVSVAECRGGFLVAALASFDVGVMLCLLLAELLGRRHLAVAGLVLVLPLFASLLLAMPESPRFVAATGNKVGAEISLRLLRGLDYYSESELNLVLTNLDSAGSLGSAWLRAHTRRPALRALMVAALLTFLVPGCGFSTVTSFTVGLFVEHGLRVQRTALFCVTLIKIGATSAAALLVDRLGRRLPLLLAAAAQALALMVLALCALMLSPEQVYSRAGTALLLLVVGVFVIGAGIGMSTVPWLLVAELFPQRSRAVGPALSSVSYWAGDLVSAWLSIWVQTTLGASGVLWLHFLCTTVAYLFVFFLVPETREKALEEIEVYFTEKTSKKIQSRVPSVLITRL